MSSSQTFKLPDLIYGNLEHHITIKPQNITLHQLVDKSYETPTIIHESFHNLGDTYSLGYIKDHELSAFSNTLHSTVSGNGTYQHTMQDIENYVKETHLPNVSYVEHADGGMTFYDLKGNFVELDPEYVQDVKEVVNNLNTTSAVQAVNEAIEDAEMM